jgi:tetrahydromethanopterin S-methyltransferase subunit F
LEELVNKLVEDIEGKTKLRKKFGSLRAGLKNSDIKGLKRRLKNSI